MCEFGAVLSTVLVAAHSSLRTAWHDGGKRYVASRHMVITANIYVILSKATTHHPQAVNVTLMLHRP